MEDALCRKEGEMLAALGRVDALKLRLQVRARAYTYPSTYLGLKNKKTYLLYSLIRSRSGGDVVQMDLHDYIGYGMPRTASARSIVRPHPTARAIATVPRTPHKAALGVPSTSLGLKTTPVCNTPYMLKTKGTVSCSSCRPR